MQNFEKNGLSSDEIHVINMLGEPSYISHKEMAFFCPKCNPPHHKPKLFVNRKELKYHCFVCGFVGVGVQSLAKKLRYKGTSINSIKNEDLISSLENIMHLKSNTKEDEVAQMPRGLVNIIENKVLCYPAIEYLNKRDILEDDIFKLRILYSYINDESFSLRGRVVFPSFDSEGKFNYLVARATWEKPENSEFYLKYKQGPENMSVYDIIFNELNIDWNYPIVITEGPFDAARIFNAIPLLGKKLTIKHKLFKEILKRDQPVIVALDPDAKKEQVDLCNLLKFYDISDVRYVDFPKDKDAGSLSRSEINDHLLNSSIFIDISDLDLAKRIENGFEISTQTSIF